MNRLENSLTENHGRYIGLAYRMLGSRTDAEDILQDAYLKVGNIDSTEIRDAEAYLVTIISRMCLDQLKSARARRETYIGPWLPEPILDAEELTPHGNSELADDLSFALLLTLQKLSSSERAAFLLHDVFDTSFAQISSILGKSEAACRQLATRARKSIHANRPSNTVTPDVHQTLLEEFTEAAKSGNTADLVKLLSEDVVAYTDGGGQKIAALRPIYGAEKVTRFFLGITRKSLDRLEASDIVLCNINGIPGLIFRHKNEIDQTVTLEVNDGKISAIYMVRNPHKLRGLQ